MGVARPGRDTPPLSDGDFVGPLVLGVLDVDGFDMGGREVLISAAGFAPPVVTGAIRKVDGKG